MCEGGIPLRARQLGLGIPAWAPADRFATTSNFGARWLLDEIGNRALDATTAVDLIGDAFDGTLRVGCRGPDALGLSGVGRLLDRR